MRELLSQLDELKRQWYANEIESDTFAYKVFDVTSQLEALIPREHTDFCQMICVCE